MAATATATESVVPLTEAASKLRLSREQVIRRILKGRLDGGQVHGRWVVTAQSLERALADGTPHA